jgi:hypothetical protein
MGQANFTKSLQSRFQIQGYCICIVHDSATSLREMLKIQKLLLNPPNFVWKL